MTFDGANKRIILSSATTSATELWSEWVRWLASDSNNSKWLPAMSQVGGDELGSGLLIPPYIFLLNGWRVRPMESNHLLVISGNLYVDGGGQPVVNTVGSYNVSVQYTVPVQAQGYSTTSSSSTLTADEIWNYTTRSLTASTTSSLTEEQNAKLMSLDTSNINVDPASIWTHPTRSLSEEVQANITKVNGVSVTSVDDFKADVSGISVNVDPQDIWEYSDRSLTVPSGLTTGQAQDLGTILTKVSGTIDSNIKSVNGLTVTSVNDFKADVSGISVNVDPEDIWSHPTRTLTVTAGLTALQEAKIDAIKSKTDQFVFDMSNRILSYIEDKANFSLSATDKEILAGVIEAHIINETDSNAVLQAITDKISSVNPSLGELTLSAIANSVWTAGNALTPLQIWNHGTRSLTNKDANIISITGTQVNNIQDFRNDMTETLNAISGIPGAVWLQPSRTVNNTISVDPASIWSYVDRTLTNTDVNVKSINGVNVTNINDFKTDVSNIAAQVWAYGTRLTTDTKMNPSDIWNFTARTLTANNANIVSLNGNAVTLEDFKTTVPEVDLSGIPAAVWGNPVRSITNSLLSAGDIWGYHTRALTNKDANIISVNGTAVNNIGDFKPTIPTTDLSGIPSAVWAYANRSVGSVDIASVNGIEVTGPDDFKAQIDVDLSGIPYAVWNYGNKTVNAFISAADIWAYANKSVNVVTIAGQNVTKAELTAVPEVSVDLSSIPADVWNYGTRTFTNTLNIPTTSDIWGHSTRSLTDRAMDISTVKGQAISGINDFKTDISSISNIPAAVWAYSTRSLSSSISVPTAAEIWAYSNRSLNTSVDVTSIKGESISKMDLSSVVDVDLSSIPADVWSYGSRITTDTKLSPADIWSYNTRTITGDLLPQNIEDRILNIPVYGDVVDSNILEVNSSSVVIDDFKDSITYEGIWNYSTRNITGPVDIKSDLRTKLMDLVNYSDSEIKAKLIEIAESTKTSGDNILDVLALKPSLSNIENSTILAKKSDVSAVEVLVNSIPKLSEIVSEFKNIQFGKMEIVGNQMKVWDQGDNLIVTYNLFDKNGLPTMGSVYKKEIA